MEKENFGILKEAKDKERKEAVDTRNNVDSMVMQTKKTLTEQGANIDAGIKEKIEKLAEADPEHTKKHIMMIHYPPITARQDFTEFAHMMAEGGVDICVYGHLHGKAHKKAFEGKFEGTEFVCASIDYVGFKPVKIL